MAEIRLNKLIKQFNIGLDMLVDFLNSKGAGIEHANPNMKVSDEYLPELHKKFGKDLELKEAAEKVDAKLTEILDKASRRTVGISDQDQRATVKKPASVAPEEFDWDAFESESVAGENREEVAALYDHALAKIVENEVVEGVITSINRREVTVNIGSRCEGVISSTEFRYNPDLKVGDKVEVLVESAADRKGLLVISHKKARQLKSWDMVTKAYDSGEIVKGYIKTRTKGGMIVDIFGIEAFLPGSQIDTKPIRDFDAFVDTTMDFKIIKVNKEFRNVVVSHKALLEVPKKDTEDREANLAAKRAVINDLKTLIADAQYGSIKDAFPLFREIQTRWREIGPVPSEYFRDINESYQLYVEKFYDLVVIDRETRDLDFRANLEAKTQLCEQAEALVQREDVPEAFKELQKLHERWKEYGPVAKELRDGLWERFRAATTVINKKYQAHFSEQMAANLEAKTRLCEQAEALAQREDVTEAFKELQTLHAQWMEIGPVPYKSNDSIWERFRAATSIINHRYKAYCKETGIPWKPIKLSTPTATGEDAKTSPIPQVETAPKKSIAPEIDPSTFFSAKAQKLLSMKKED